MADYFVNDHHLDGVYAAIILARHCWAIYAISANDGDCGVDCITADGADFHSGAWWLHWEKAH